MSSSQITSKSVAGKWPKGRVLANPRKDTLHHGPLCSSSLERRDLPTRKRRQTAGNGIPVPTETPQPSRRHSRFICRGPDQAPLPKAHPAVWVTFLLSGENALTDQRAWKIVYPCSLFKGTQSVMGGGGDHSSRSSRQLVTLCPQSWST